MSISEQKDFIEKQFNILESLIELVDSTDTNKFTIQSQERLVDNFKRAIDNFQEQPHLLGPKLSSLTSRLIELIRKYKNDSKERTNLAFTLLYLITKVRGFKTVVRYLPHEVSDVEPVLNHIAQFKPHESNDWESQYMLLLWLSVLVLIPLDFNRFNRDSNGKSVCDR